MPEALAFSLPNFRIKRESSLLSHVADTIYYSPRKTHTNSTLLPTQNLGTSLAFCALKLESTAHIPSIEYDPDDLHRAATIAALLERIGERFSRRWTQSWFVGTNSTLSGAAPIQIIARSDSGSYVPLLDATLVLRISGREYLKQRAR